MLSRRDFVKGLALGVAAVTSGTAFSQQTVLTPYALDMQRRGERFLLDLRTTDGLKAAAWLLRDIQAGNVIGRPNTDTLRLAAWAQAALAAQGAHSVFDIHSGLRTLSTNLKTEGHHQNSRHLPNLAMVFSAIDLNPIGINKEYFGNLIAQPKFGGVGWYSTHIHFDVRERPTYWRKGV
ncbi:MAG: D-Ala-D-Ala carboxypeptidase family metallohydrolase [bacterium]|nr:D-Ala-D-Ala carboxypeptidase family metallohydrolase [bacterium]